MVQIPYYLVMAPTIYRYKPKYVSADRDMSENVQGQGPLWLEFAVQGTNDLSNVSMEGCSIVCDVLLWHSCACATTEHAQRHNNYGQKPWTIPSVLLRAD